MLEPRYMFIKFRDNTLIQVSEIAHIDPDKHDTSNQQPWKMRLKDGTSYNLTTSEYNSLVEALDGESNSIGLIKLDED